MAETYVDALFLGKIGRDFFNHRPKYAYRRYWDFDPRKTLEKAIEFAKEQARKGGNGDQAEPEEAEPSDRQAEDHEAEAHGHAEDHEHRPADRPSERYLDIAETRTRGVCLYAFYLEDISRLEFRKDYPRFIKIPLNSSTEEDFIEEVEIYDDAKKWAFFTCDLDDVRTNGADGLVRRIKDRAKPHIYRLNLPFYFNVWDPTLEAAPWVLSDYFHRGHGHRDHGDREKPDAHAEDSFTHGGVHPIPTALLSLPI